MERQPVLSHQEVLAGSLERRSLYFCSQSGNPGSLHKQRQRRLTSPSDLLQRDQPKGLGWSPVQLWKHLR